MSDAENRWRGEIYVSRRLLPVYATVAGWIAGRLIFYQIPVAGLPDLRRCLEGNEIDN
jgi:hypothetical protein